ncbi:MAG TPA: Arc family DNA binding domain-containing protein [Candidatus Limicola stercorigallinarum]|nr:Arc family DNA binding domain-containing protein [Candidatus Limicola stercorigallinarum]
MARKQYPLRIDPAIWEAVQRWADDEMRSANGQVEWILRDALRRAGRLPRSNGTADPSDDRPPGDEAC